MAEAVRTMKANKKVAGVACGWCLNPLQLGEDAAVCAKCEKVHHGACYDDKNGCANPSCEYAPAKQLEPPPQVAQPADDMPPGYMKCPGCGHLVPQTSDICNLCDHILSPDGIYRGPKENAPGAVGALVWGIVGLFICGFIFGAIAISQSQKAKANIALNPRYGGEGMATAGFVLGIIGIIGHLVVLLLNLAMR